MIVISDTSPIINLAAINQLDLIPKLFAHIIIPQAVFDEITIKGFGKYGSSEILNAEWITVKQCTNTVLLNNLLLELDLGEAEAIALAIEMNTQSILLDESDGRTIALQYKLKPIGILGILLEAKNKGLIPNVKDCIENLQIIANFYISKPIYNHILQLAGEL